MFKVGVTGHRDLKVDCLEFYKKQVNNLLASLKKEHKELIILSPIADGADRVVVKEGLKLGIDFISVLPLPKEMYKMDFSNESSKEFEALLLKSKTINNIPLLNRKEELLEYNSKRDLQYEAAGQYLADNCNILIALWDNKKLGLVGGTGEIVKYYLKKDSYHLAHLLVSRNNGSSNLLVEFKEYKKTI